MILIVIITLIIMTLRTSEPFKHTWSVLSSSSATKASIAKVGSVLRRGCGRIMDESGRLATELRMETMHGGCSGVNAPLFLVVNCVSADRTLLNVLNGSWKVSGFYYLYKLAWLTTEAKSINAFPRLCNDTFKPNPHWSSAAYVRLHAHKINPKPDTCNCLKTQKPTDLTSE